ncbi:MAG: threonine/serine dehydratase [Alphaproteobacteria bacterium]|nr:threonine/serine dehydratase [Alphaproteobacteria bacterium]
MSHQAPDPLPNPSDIIAAANRLAGHAVRTPLLNAPLLDDLVGTRVLVKPEMLQRTGSFKFRGAYNRISMIPEADREKGVIAFSSGNHAQGVACAARDFGIRATIVMPADAPHIKVENTRSYGADVRLYDRYRENRQAIGEALAAETGATLVKPYDDPGIIAGQGTVGLEIAEQAAELGMKPDIVLVCCGGGGLVSGTALALSEYLPHADVYSVEPAGFDDTARSLAAGERLENAPGAASICDALLASTPGELTFALISRFLKGGLMVTDTEALDAMAVAFRYLKLVSEPGGAVALAALLAGRVDVRGKTVAVVMSGGNVDPARFREALA